MNSKHSVQDHSRIFHFSPVVSLGFSPKGLTTKEKNAVNSEKGRSAKQLCRRLTL